MLRNLFLTSLIALLPALTQAQQPVLVSPQWLHENLKDPDLVILYTGFVIRSDFDREHIAGSRFLWPDWLAFDTPEGTMNAPDARTATKTLQDLGIRKTSKIVICHRGSDISIAARMFMTLEHLGLAGRVSFLNGGLEAWKKAGFPVTDQPSIFKKGDFVVTSRPVIVDKRYVQDALQKPDHTVVDARMKRFYDGDPTGNPRDGHITGAINLPFPDMLDSSGHFKPISVLEQNFSPALPSKDKELVVYCFIGQTACVDYLAGRALGYKMKVYDGSLQEWSRDFSLPMEKTKKD